MPQHDDADMTNEQRGLYNRYTEPEPSTGDQIKSKMANAVAPIMIVKRLSECAEPTDRENSDCLLCGSSSFGYHEDDCPWKLAQAWAKAQ